MRSVHGRVSLPELRRCVVVLAVLVLGAAGLLAGCGGAGKPAYCSDVTNFKNAVDQATHVSSVSELKPALQKVQSTGQAALSSLKSDLAPQTTDVKNALKAVETSVGQLSSSSTRATAISALPGQVKALGTAANNLAGAAKPKC